MPEPINTTLTNTLFMKILPLLLSGAIVWIISSINSMQVQSARIEIRVIENQNLLKNTSDKIDNLENKTVTQQISISLLEQELVSLRKEFERHLHERGE